MAKPTASFPGAVWDGTNAGRADYVGDFQTPDQDDYDRLVEEMKAIQTMLRTNGGVGVIEITTPNSAGDTDVLAPYNIRIVDVVAVKIAANGGSGDTVTVKNVGNAITNAMSLNINDAVVARATSLDDSRWDVDAGAIIRATTAKVTDCQSIVRVYYKLR